MASLPPSNSSGLSQDRPDDVTVNINDLAIETVDGNEWFTLNLPRPIQLGDDIKSSVYIALESGFGEFAGSVRYGHELITQIGDIGGGNTFDFEWWSATVDAGVLSRYEYHLRTNEWYVGRLLPWLIADAVNQNSLGPVAAPVNEFHYDNVNDRFVQIPINRAAWGTSLAQAIPANYTLSVSRVENRAVNEFGAQAIWDVNGAANTNFQNDSVGWLPNGCWFSPYVRFGPQMTRCIETKSKELLDSQVAAYGPVYAARTAPEIYQTVGSMRNYMVLPTDQAYYYWYTQVACLAQYVSNDTLSILGVPDKLDPVVCFCSLNTVGAAPVRSTMQESLFMPVKFSVATVVANHGNEQQMARSPKYGCLPNFPTQPEVNDYFTVLEHPMTFGPYSFPQFGVVRGQPFLGTVNQYATKQVYRSDKLPFIDFGVMTRCRNYHCCSPFNRSIDMLVWQQLYNEHPLGFSSLTVAKQSARDVVAFGTGGVTSETVAATVPTTAQLEAMAQMRSADYPLNTPTYAKSLANSNCTNPRVAQYPYHAFTQESPGLVDGSTALKNVYPPPCDIGWCGYMGYKTVNDGRMIRPFLTTLTTYPTQVADRSTPDPSFVVPLVGTIPAAKDYSLAYGLTTQNSTLMHYAAPSYPANGRAVTLLSYLDSSVAEATSNKTYSSMYTALQGQPLEPLLEKINHSAGQRWSLTHFVENNTLAPLTWSYQGVVTLDTNIAYQNHSVAYGPAGGITNAPIALQPVPAGRNLIPTETGTGAPVAGNYGWGGGGMWLRTPTAEVNYRWDWQGARAASATYAFHGRIEQTSWLSRHIPMWCDRAGDDTYPAARTHANMPLPMTHCSRYMYLGTAWVETYPFGTAAAPYNQNFVTLSFMDSACAQSGPTGWVVNNQVSWYSAPYQRSTNSLMTERPVQLGICPDSPAIQTLQGDLNEKVTPFKSFIGSYTDMTMAVPYTNMGNWEYGPFIPLCHTGKTNMHFNVHRSVAARVNDRLVTKHFLTQRIDAQMSNRRYSGFISNSDDMTHFGFSALNICYWPCPGNAGMANASVAAQLTPPSPFPTHPGHLLAARDSAAGPGVYTLSSLRDYTSLHPTVITINPANLYYPDDNQINVNTAFQTLNSAAPDWLTRAINNILRGNARSSIEIECYETGVDSITNRRTIEYCPCTTATAQRGAPATAFDDVGNFLVTQFETSGSFEMMGHTRIHYYKLCGGTNGNSPAVQGLTKLHIRVLLNGLPVSPRLFSSLSFRLRFSKTDWNGGPGMRRPGRCQGEKRALERTS